MDLGVAGGAAAELPEGTEVVELQSVAAEVEHGVEQDRGVAVGEDEPVPVGPVGLGGIMVHDPGEQHMGQRGQGHGGTRMSGVGGPGGIHGQPPDHVDAELLECSIAGDVGCDGIGSCHWGHPTGPEG